MQKTTALDQLIADLERIRSMDDGRSRPRSVSLRCAACIAFTDKFLRQIKRRAELSGYLAEIRRQAIALKQDCDRVERNRVLKNFNPADVQEAYSEILGLVENVCLLVEPKLVGKVDASAAL